MTMLSWLSGKDRKHANTTFDKEALVHLSSIYNSALYLTRKPDAAEDLTQETFLKAYRHFDKYQPGTNCRAWLHRIMKNTFLNQVRREVREVSFLDETSGNFIEAKAVEAMHDQAHRFDPEVRFLSQGLSEEVKDAVATLPPEFRLAVVLCDLQDFSYREIADVMDCPVGTVMSRIYRGRQLLKKSLLQRAIDQGIIEAPMQPSPELTSLDEFRQRRTQSGGGDGK